MRSSLFAPLCKCVGLVLLMLNLVACDDDDNGRDYTGAYLQFYNASPDSATVSLLDEDEDELGSASFGNSTQVFSLDNGTEEYYFTYEDEDDTEITIETLELKLKTSYKTLIVMAGDFDDPEFFEFQFERESLDDHFKLFGTTVMSDEATLDIYLADDGNAYEDANYLGTMEYGVLQEYEYWDEDADDDSDDFESDDYTLYLTETGTDTIVFESDTLTLSTDTEIVLIARDVSGALSNSDNMSVDIVMNSSTVTEEVDVDAESQYRIYNSLNYDSPITVTLSAGNSSDSTTFELEAGEITSFTSIDYGDYNLSLTIGDGSLVELSNKLITLNQSESKAIIIYEDVANAAIEATSFVESSTSQAYDKTINFINLVPDFPDVDFYMVREDETSENAEYSVTSVELAETEEEDLPEDEYEVVVVYEDVNDEQTLLDRTESMAFDETANYFITVEPTDEGNGYEIVINYE